MRRYTLNELMGLAQVGDETYVDSRDHDAAIGALRAKLVELVELVEAYRSIASKGMGLDSAGAARFVRDVYAAEDPESLARGVWPKEMGEAIVDNRRAISDIEKRLEEADIP